MSSAGRNWQRAEKAANALKPYADNHRQAEVTDLLTDIYHLLQREGVEHPHTWMSERLDTAHDHYLAEKETK